MASFAYRGVTLQGQANTGEVQARDKAEAVQRIRSLGVVPVEIKESITASAQTHKAKADMRTRSDVARSLGELGVLLNAGIPLDRALALGLDTIERPAVSEAFRRLLVQVREGTPLSQAMTEEPALFPPSAQAVIEAGEANGKLGDALARVARIFAQEEEMRRLVSGAMIYPMALMLLAGAVILVMLLYVVPQFESLFASAQDRLPASSRALMAASQGLREHGLILMVLLIASTFGIGQMVRQPRVRIARDRLMLRLPQIGPLVRAIEASRLARTLGGLIEGGVPLPDALAMACRSISNYSISRSIADVAAQVREGGALTPLIAATGALPRMAIGFFRTGEESSQLGVMLERLADVLERDVTRRIERLVAILTPAITIGLGGAVAAIIASIMTAILGFNDLAVGQ